LAGGTEKDIEELEKKIRIGPPWLTRFERARVIGARALQISLGAPILLNPDELPDYAKESPVLIAKLELERGILPMTIIRYTRAGDIQAIPVEWLIKLDKMRPRIH
jgi:DNA-directed RNA polymerase I, II, and III subunit RPABC2/DNA-directed RNA polymerase subunit K